jgi:molybdopterin-guanine dinucleotide biosynthesis adapter protein
MRPFGVVGHSGSGKTTMLERLIPHLVSLGRPVSLIKHAHHGFDIDRPGKDSFRHRHAGCTEVLLASDARWALMHELRDEREPRLEDLLAHLAPCDLVLIEGFKSMAVPKIEVWRPSLGRAPLYPHDRRIVAVASDERFAAPIPVVGLGDTEAIARVVLNSGEAFRRSA